MFFQHISINFQLVLRPSSHFYDVLQQKKQEKDEIDKTKSDVAKEKVFWAEVNSLWMLNQIAESWR